MKQRRRHMSFVSRIPPSSLHARAAPGLRCQGKGVAPVWASIMRCESQGFSKSSSLFSSLSDSILVTWILTPTREEKEHTSEGRSMTNLSGQISDLAPFSRSPRQKSRTRWSLSLSASGCRHSGRSNFFSPATSTARRPPLVLLLLAAVAAAAAATTAWCGFQIRGYSSMMRKQTAFSPTTPESPGYRCLQLGTHTIPGCSRVR
mmetsp:Transcript_76222/g.166367  ORF Transcript_76222/g.166367 Transcript_76222/m.166367 type:complete len:204 (-) Transcript_76222:2637-3248(-)